MEPEANQPEVTFTAQEVEEIVFLDEVEKELESVEQSFCSGDLQCFGRNKLDIKNRFSQFRKKDEEMFICHCNEVL